MKAFLPSLAFVVLSMNGCGVPAENENKLAQEKQPELASLQNINEDALGLGSEAPLTAQQLELLELPMAGWADHPKLIDEIVETGPNLGENQGYIGNGECPNFDIDGNGVIEYVETKDASGKSVWKGDGAILAQNILRSSAKLGWLVQHDLNGKGAKRSPYSQVDYMNCLVSRLGNGNGVNKLDADVNGKLNASDATRVLRAILGLPVGIGKTKAQRIALERIIDHSRICYAYFTLNNGPKPRMYHVECGSGKAINRRLPDIRSELSADKRTCSFKLTDGTVVRNVSPNIDGNCGS